FKVDGRALRIRDTWKLEDANGREVATIRERKLSIRDAIKIESDGREAVVKKALVGIRDRFHVEVDRGHDLKVHGNIVDHEYEIEREGDTIANVSKKWFRVRDTYGVEVHEPADAPLVLAVTVAVDALTRR
ncbi:LURP-one-related/scramblase family protein, partial [Ilumatobacter sp.]|uniref:LURP-one-related/scramblase family protein n=1 Tax=Ilumatobacter sp. TaxID=1967498 RepID=UPI003C3B42CD